MFLAFSIPTWLHLATHRLNKTLKIAQLFPTFCSIDTKQSKTNLGAISYKHYLTSYISGAVQPNRK